MLVSVGNSEDMLSYDVIHKGRNYIECTSANNSVGNAHAERGHFTT